ncbi:GNAT family N-acetyltransferase [Paracidovorax anthurii]|uniref:Acetyltransferase (GNAT) family protein n=1 Tax=Paracidovorax anthurii TaxID=78229 RepID=A0A328YTG8_9BURK|nr:GNAT family N-acetyltransferase [Paracidovorax anthurii]RAR76413.1 acetyltransferase (GNAT) family protein [Paracidovorax anthurii]WCM94808.1 GNAT family N-acetyltransferase [Acidovorax sp. NCPPB 2350]
MTYHDATAQVEKLPRDLPRFDTGRFMVIPLAPGKARELLTVLLGDEKLAAQLPWMKEKTADGARREAFLIELQCGAELTAVWGIVSRDRGAYIGAVVARNTLDSMDVEVLCASKFWGQGVADEAGWPVAEWLEENTEVEIVVA